jgi:hypothetical protein
MCWPGTHWPGIRWIVAVGLVACSQNDDIPEPAISSAVPERGTPGTAVTITGTHLCQIAHEDDDEGAPLVCPDGGAVYFGEHLGTALAWEDESIMVEVPDGTPGEVDLRVQAKGRTSNSIDFIIE